LNAAVPSYVNWNLLEHAYGAAPLRAAFQQQPADFRVAELLGFEPDGPGEHLLPRVAQSGLTTFAAPAILGRHFTVVRRDTA